MTPPELITPRAMMSGLSFDFNVTRRFGGVESADVEEDVSASSGGVGGASSPSRSMVIDTGVRRS
jgi:hypothetical protein